MDEHKDPVLTHRTHPFKPARPPTHIVLLLNQYISDELGTVAQRGNPGPEVPVHVQGDSNYCLCVHGCAADQGIYVQQRDSTGKMAHVPQA